MRWFSLNLLWLSFYGTYKSNHYAVYLKHTVLYVNYISIKMGGEEGKTVEKISERAEFFWKDKQNIQTFSQIHQKEERGLK